MPQRILRYGSTVNLDSFDVLAFDLDHTIARYKIQNLMELVYKCLKHTLIEQFHYAPSSMPLPYDPNVIQKGLVTDFHTGDVLKLDDEGHIGVAYHGTTRLHSREIKEKYGETKKWPGFQLLKDRKRHDSFFALMTYFDCPSIGLFMQLVDAADKADSPGKGTGTGDFHLPSAALPNTAGTSLPPGVLPVGVSYDSLAIPPKYLKIKADLVGAFDYIFDNVAAFPTGRGGFFSEVKARPHDFIVPRPKLKARLRAIRESGKHILMLVTNSHLHFAESTLVAVFGEDWQNCFDVILFNSMKPQFFGKDAAYHFPDWVAGTEGEVLKTWNIVFSPSKLSAETHAAMATRGGARSLQQIFDFEKQARLAHPDSHADPHVIHLSVALSAAGEVQAADVKEIGRRRPDATTPVVTPSAAVSTKHAPQTLALTESNALSGPTSETSSEPTAEAVLAEHVARARSKNGTAEVIYFGDYIHGDVIPAVVDARWAAIAVVEELECSSPQPTALHEDGGYASVPPILSDGIVDNFTPEVDGSRVWGPFFAASPETPERRSYFCRALATYSVMAVTDVEVLLEAM